MPLCSCAFSRDHTVQLPEVKPEALIIRPAPDSPCKRVGHAIRALLERRCKLPYLEAVALDPEHLSSTDLVADVVHTARDENSVRSRHAVSSLRLILTQGHKGMRGIFLPAGDEAAEAEYEDPSEVMQQVYGTVALHAEVSPDSKLSWKRRPSQLVRTSRPAPPSPT